MAGDFYGVVGTLADSRGWGCVNFCEKKKLREKIGIYRDSSGVGPNALPHNPQLIPRKCGGLPSWYEPFFSNIFVISTY